jgi:hypothetical protein
MLAVFTATTAHAASPWTTSADIRERYQNFNDYNFNSSVDNNRWELDSRLYIKARADFGHGVTAYVQPQAILIQDHTSSHGNQTLSQADLLQAYLQYHVGDFALRLGRQQLAYGDQRLIGRLGWKDVARTFDGGKFMYRLGHERLDVFAVHPADLTAMTPTPTVPHGQSLVTWGDRRLVGIYNTYEIDPHNGIDVYVINWQHNQQAVVGPGRNINTYGSRLFTHWKALDLTAEAVFQRGTWSNGVAQRASAYAIKSGYTLGFWKTRLGIEYDYSPGDNKSNPAIHKDFVFPYHTNHAHYGEMDFFSWGNMKDVDLSLKTSPHAGLKLIGNVHFLSLDKATGDWLNVVGTGVVFKGNPAYTQKKAGTETDIKFIYNVAPMKGLKVIGLYGVFAPGAAVSERNNGRADTATFGYLIANYNF